MCKQEFLEALRVKLSGLPTQEVEDRLNFYSEMIDDRIEEGRTEEQAVSDIGSVDEIFTQIIADIPLSSIAKEKIRPQKPFKAWEITLLVLGSPIWFSLAVAALAVLLSLYAALWSVILSLWAVFVSLACCAFCGIASGVVFIVGGSSLAGIATVGASIFCAGMAIFLFFGCKTATRGTALLAHKMAFGIKKCFVKKEKAHE